MSGARIAVCNLGSPGAFLVRNESDPVVSLHSRVDVQMRPAQGSWKATQAFFYLDPDCKGEPPRKRCVSLEPAAVLQPRTWSGFSCSGQCRQGCPDNHYLRGWPLRFVLSSCDGQQQAVSPPFRLQEYQDQLARTGGQSSEVPHMSKRALVGNLPQWQTRSMPIAFDRSPSPRP